MINSTKIMSATTKLLLNNTATQTTENQTLLLGANASGYFIDPEFEDSRFSEDEKILFACVTLLVPMVCAVFIGLGIRKLIKRDSNEGYLDLNCSLCKKKGIEPTKSNHLMPPEEMKIGGTQFSEVPSVEELDEVVAFSGGGGSGGLRATNSHSGNHTSKSTATANGSIITMTMKNNHLIVETEEPESSISAVDAPSILYRNNGNELLVVELQSEGDERALVHQAADSSTDLLNLSQTQQQNQRPVSSLQRSSTNTGMSQSDLSSSSAGSTCHPYDYGSQTEYVYEGGGIIRQNFNRSDSTTCPLVQSSQEDLPFDNNPPQNHDEDDDNEDNYLRLQQQLGNGHQQPSTTSVRKLSADQQPSVQQPPLQKDPILLKASTLPTTATIQYHSVYNIRPSQDNCPPNVVS